MHPVAGAEPAPLARETLREIIASDAYAATFQTIGQYRSALLQHLANRKPNTRITDPKATP